MVSSRWWQHQKKRIKKKYKLFLGFYLSPREMRLMKKKLKYYNNAVIETRSFLLSISTGDYSNE